jgi:hypothetical protein
MAEKKTMERFLLECDQDLEVRGRVMESLQYECAVDNIIKIANLSGISITARQVKAFIEATEKHLRRNSDGGLERPGHGLAWRESWWRTVDL